MTRVRSSIWRTADWQSYKPCRPRDETRCSMTTTFCTRRERAPNRSSICPVLKRTIHMLHPSTASSESFADFGPDHNSEIFDLAEAMYRTCDDWDLLAELAELFVENRDNLLNELTEAIAAR